MPRPACELAKPLVRELITTTARPPEASLVVLPCSTAVVTFDLHFVAAVIRRHRREIGSRWRALDPGQQAMLALVYLRKGEPFTDLAAGFNISTSTAWRYVEETTALLAAQAPRLKTALRTAKAAGHSYLILDGRPLRQDEKGSLPVVLRRLPKIALRARGRSASGCGAMPDQGERSADGMLPLGVGRWL